MGGDSTEAEVERLLQQWIPASPLRGLTYIVGGYVRDQVLGLVAQDLDLVVEKKGGARELADWLHAQAPAAISHPHPLGAGYPIWHVVFKGDVTVDGKIYHTHGCEIEIADTQSESFPDPTTRQRVTVFGNLDEDCRRRDFTTNMLYRDLTTGALLDPSETGEHDIRMGILRGHPQVSLKKIFSDDPLRMLRLVRFHCRFGWEIPESVLQTVRECADRLEILSVERIRDELTKMMTTRNFHKGLELIERNGMLVRLLPELVPMVGCTQDRSFHAEGDVWTHTLLVVSHAPPTVPLQLAALLHDVGKPRTRTVVGERIKFLGHEVVSVEITEALLTRLHFDTATIRKVKSLVRLHMRGADVEDWATNKPTRKLMRDAGEDTEELLQLIEADSRSSLNEKGEFRIQHVAQLRERMKKTESIPIPTRALLDGNEIMGALGIAGGPRVAEVKRYVEKLEDEWAEVNKVLTKDEAIRQIRAHFSGPNSSD